MELHFLKGRLKFPEQEPILHGMTRRLPFGLLLPMNRVLWPAGLTVGLLASGLALAQDAPKVVDGPRCVPIDGATLELAGSEFLRVKQAEKSVALIRTSMFLPAGLYSMRFLAPEICDRGAKSHVIINDWDYRITEVRLVDGQPNGREATANPDGRSVTVRGPGG